MGNGQVFDPGFEAFLIVRRVTSPIGGYDNRIAAEPPLVAIDGGQDGLGIAAVGKEYIPVRDDSVLHLVHLHFPAEFAGRPEFAFRNGAHGGLEDGDDAISDLLAVQGIYGLADEDVGEFQEMIQLQLRGKGREIANAAEFILHQPSPLRGLLRDLHYLTSDRFYGGFGLSSALLQGIADFSHLVLDIASFGAEITLDLHDGCQLINCTGNDPHGVGKESGIRGIMDMRRSDGGIGAQFPTFNNSLLDAVFDNLVMEFHNRLLPEKQLPFVQSRVIRCFVRERELGESFPGVIGLQALLHVAEGAILVEVLEEN